MRIYTGPVDTALPVLRVTDPAGKVRAIFSSYACHCTADGGADGGIHSDWAGEASAQFEEAHPGAVVLFGIGCGGDAGPVPRGSIEAAREIGQLINAEIGRILAAPMHPLGRLSEARYQIIDLALDHTVTRQNLTEQIAQGPRPEAYAAGKFLAVLDSGRSLPTTVPYPVQLWVFGPDLAMMFLGGEVVSDYSLRLRRECDATRLWVNAYANAVPCYIPSARMFPEGGYEVDSSIKKYGWPTRLDAGIEEHIITTVMNMLPESFKQTDHD